MALGGFSAHYSTRPSMWYISPSQNLLRFLTSCRMDTPLRGWQWIFSGKTIYKNGTLGHPLLEQFVTQFRKNNFGPSQHRNFVQRTILHYLSKNNYNITATRNTMAKYSIQIKHHMNLRTSISANASQPLLTPLN